jgi:hypothetical protein
MLVASSQVPLLRVVTTRPNRNMYYSEKFITPYYHRCNKTEISGIKISSPDETRVNAKAVGEQVLASSADNARDLIAGKNSKENLQAHSNSDVNNIQERAKKRCLITILIFLIDSF